MNDVTEQQVDKYIQRLKMYRKQKEKDDEQK